MLWVSGSFLMGCSKIKLMGRRTVLSKNVITKEEVLRKKMYYSTYMPDLK